MMVVAPGPDLAERLADQAVAGIVDLEHRWSRFRPDSEVSLVNAASPEPHPVSNATLLLASRAVDAARETGGRFDATMLPQIMEVGYDRSFELLPTTGDVREASRADRPAAAPSPSSNGGPGPCPRHRTAMFARDGWSGGDGPGGALLVDTTNATVAVRAGHGLDPGGIGKGLAADMITADLMEMGATGALVNLGGDLRVRGEAPGSGGWVVSIDHPSHPGRELARMAIDDGGVATSSRLIRRWHGPRGTEVHHLLNPADGHPVETDVVSVTVVSGDAWWAEALAKALFCLGPDRALGHVHHGAAIVVDAVGGVHASPSLTGVLR